MDYLILMGYASGHHAIQRIRKVENSYYAAAMSGICYLIIVSMAESAFVHPIAVPIAMMIGAFLGKCE